MPAKKTIEISLDEDVIQRIVETNVALQKKITDLVVSTNDLNQKVSRVVSIFEDAAKHIKPGLEDEQLSPLINKLEELLDQNKTIAKGLVLLERYVREKERAVEAYQHKPMSPL